MPQTRFILRFVDTGCRVLHEDGYVFAFLSPSHAAESSRDLRQTYGVRTYMEEVESDTPKLPLTDKERWILEHSEGIALPGSVHVTLPEDVLAKEEALAAGPGKRKIRVRRK